MSSVHSLARLDAVAQAALVRRGDTSSRELLEACAARAAAIDPLIHALTVTDFERARAYLEVFRTYDVILTPTLAVAPWRLGHLSPTRDREELLRRTEHAVGYTPIHNIAGCPAMSVPLSWSRAGLPIGTHFAAAPGRDAALLGLAYELEAVAPWADRWAPRSFPKVFEDDAAGA